MAVHYVIMLLVQYHNPIKTIVTAASTLCCYLSAWWSYSASRLTSLSGLSFSHMTSSHFKGQLSFCLRFHDYIRALCPTSSPPVMWVAMSSWVSAPESEIRVKLQSVPLLPLLMLRARKRATGSPAATQIQPAKARTQAPRRQSATVCHFNPHTPTGLLQREGARDSWREGCATEWEKEHPEAEGSFCDVNNDLHLKAAVLLPAGCLLLKPSTNQVVAVAAECVDRYDGLEI